MINELKAVCRKKGLYTCLLVFGLAAVIAFFLRDDIRSVIILKSLALVEKKDEFFFFGIIAILLILGGLVMIFNMISGKSVKDVINFPKQHPEYTLADIEADYSASRKYDDSIFVGKKFILYVVASSVNIIDLNDVVWSYYKEQTRKGVTFRYLALRTRDNKYYEIEFKEENSISEVLHIFNALDLPVITGYTNELDKLYHKNLANFIVLAAQGENQN